MKRWLVVLSAALLTGTFRTDVGAHEETRSSITVSKAVAVLRAASGSNVRGVVTFVKVEGGVRVIADVEGLAPGEHGFHVHEFGDCSATSAASAGGHFNPHNTSHGGPDTAHQHEGDLGNIVSDDSGKAHYDRVNKLIVLEGPDSVIGRSVIVHEKTDDLEAQPAGNAGARVACGLIGIARP
jgi:Cu-Zn family superoxide dismutase